MWWCRLRSLLQDEGDESPRWENRDSWISFMCLMSVLLPVCTARQESMSVSWFNILSDSKQLLICDPNELFLE